MDSISSATVANVSAAESGTVQAVAAVSVMKQAMRLQSDATLQLLASLPQVPQVPLATSGPLGTQVNTFA